MNPNGAGVDAPWRGTDGLIALLSAWGSAAWDEANLVLHVPNGGGHNNYWGNEPYKQSFEGSRDWQILRPPSGAIGNAITLNDGAESSGVYTGDGRVRSTHVYDNLCFVPGVGPVLVRLGSVAPGSGGSNKVFAVHPSTGEPTVVFEFTAANLGYPGGFPGALGIGNAAGGSCCYVPSVGARPARIYSVGTGNNMLLSWVQPGGWTGGTSGSISNGLTGAYMRSVYWPDQDKILAISATGSTMNFRVVDPDDASLTEPTITGSFAAGFTPDSGVCGGTWSPELGKLLLWNNTSNAAQISTLTPVGDGSSSWAAGALTVSGSNVLVPATMSAAFMNATHGLFGYSSTLKGCYLLQSVDLPTLFFATE